MPDHPVKSPRKLIEIALPLDAIYQQVVIALGKAKREANGGPALTMKTQYQNSTHPAARGPALAASFCTGATGHREFDDPSARRHDNHCSGTPPTRLLEEALAI